MIIIYFLQEMDLLVLDPTVLTMVGRYRADVFCMPARGDNDAMQHYALFCGDIASWEYVTAVLY